MAPYPVAAAVVPSEPSVVQFPRLWRMTLEPRYAKQGAPTIHSHSPNQQPQVGA